MKIKSCFGGKKKVYMFFRYVWCSTNLGHQFENIVAQRKITDTISKGYGSQTLVERTVYRLCRILKYGLWDPFAAELTNTDQTCTRFTQGVGINDGAIVMTTANYM